MNHTSKSILIHQKIQHGELNSEPSCQAAEVSITKQYPLMTTTIPK